MSVKEKLIQWGEGFEIIGDLQFPTVKTWSVQPQQGKHFQEELADNSDYNYILGSAVAGHRKFLNHVYHPELREADKELQRKKKH